MTLHFAMRQVAEAKAYRKSGEWAGRTIADDALRLAEAGQSGDIFLGSGSPSSVSDVLVEAEALVAALRELGLRRGDVFSFMLPNWAEAAAINLAAALGGFVVNPIVPIYRDAETSLILADCESRLIFLPTSHRRFDYAAMIDRIRANLPQLRHVVTVRGETHGALQYDDLLQGGRGQNIEVNLVEPASLKMIMYTSGTTGKPKAVLHSHETLARAVEASAKHWGIGKDDVVLMPSPITHVSGYSNGIERPFISGTRTVLMEEWDADKAVQLTERYNATMTVAATPFLQEFTAAAERAGSRLPSMRCFACGGAAIPAQLIRRANEQFAQPAAFRVYGSSEAPFVTLGYIGESTRELAASTDGAILDYEVRIVDEEHQRLPPGIDGEIQVKGPALFLGYADQTQTAEAFTSDGFFRTGDIGHIADGALIITDRKKDLIIRGGENISAKEIENVLLQHPHILEAAVVAMPHARLGEGICAFLIARSGNALSVDVLGEFVSASGLARQKSPERIEIVEELPRTASGKVRKDVLRSFIASTMTEEPNDSVKQGNHA